jgi:hypothetical protein
MKKLKELRQMLSYADVKCSFILKKLIVVSLCEIYKDIEFEETLVKQYKLYIDYLNDSIKITNKALYDMNELNKNDVDSLKSYLVVCVKCLSSLIEKLFYFNHANDLIELIVQQLTNKTTEISKLAIESVKKLYKDDKDLQLSLDVIAFYNYKLTVNIDIYYFKIER